MDPVFDPAAAIAFGRFRLLPHRRELLADGQPIKLGGRAFDVLMALIEARGAVVEKDALMTRVWPDRVVEENNLQGQIAALRKLFGAERELIRTVSRRGYQFTGDIRVDPGELGEPIAAVPPQPASVRPLSNLPQPVSELIGRDEELAEVLNLVCAHRLVTLTGVGGIGKTRLALALALELRPHFTDGIWLAELSAVADPELVPATVAAAVGLDLAGETSTRSVAQALGSRRMLLVLDTCEHVIDAAAALAQAVLGAGSAPQVIATSREALRAEGEWIYPVPALSVPAAQAATDDDPLRYGAVRLLLERAQAAQPHFATDGQSMAMVAAICRRLDGIPLALELAAARAATLGVEELAAGLDRRFHLLTGGRRTALPRHQTLRAMLDWSYQLLADAERVVLRRLAIFAGPFALDAADPVVSSPEIPPGQIIEVIASLVAKSLLGATVDGNIGRYRLLDTMRSYAFEKLAESGELQIVGRRHAEFHRDLMERAEAEWETRSTTECLADYEWRLNNVRAALDWAFSPDGDTSVGVALATAAVPLWMHLSLMTECRSRVEQALPMVGADVPGDASREMKLYAALATSLIYTGGTTPELEAAWIRTLELAERLGDTEYRLRAAWELWTLNRVSRWLRVAMTEAERFSALAANRADPNNQLIGERMLGISHHYLGNQGTARRHFETVLEQSVELETRLHLLRFQVDLRVSARTFLAPTLWLLGFPDQAMRAAQAAIEAARAADHALSECHALVFGACPTALLAGDVPAGEHYAGMLIDLSGRHGLARWHAYGRAYQGALLIRRGDSTSGLELLRAGLNELGSFATLRFMDLLMPEALYRAGQVTEGLASVDEAIERSEESEEYRLVAELFRIKGELLLRQGRADAPVAAEDLFRRALGWARRQQALSWELRAATSLARLRRDQARSTDGKALLQPVYDRFTEGFDTADVKQARELLDQLR